MADDDGLVYTLHALGSDARSVLAEIRQAGRAALITDHGRFVAAIIPFQNGQVEKQVLGAMALDLNSRPDPALQPRIPGIA